MGDVEIPNWLKELPLAPEFHPTDTEFADPIAYISKIEKEAGAFGICKVVPPLPKPSKKYVLANLNKSLLKCPELGVDVRLNNGEKVSDGEVRAVFTTRHQELGYSGGKRVKGVAMGGIQQPPPEVHKQVWQSGEIYTLEQFESKSKTFSRSQLGMVKDVSPLVVEALFWQAACDKPIYIEYANDVPGSGFGEPVGPFRPVRGRRRRTFRRNDQDQECAAMREQMDDKNRNYEGQKGESTRCSPSSSVDMLKKETDSVNLLSDHVPRQRGSSNGIETEGSAGWKLSNSPWNLQVIARSPGSLTRFMPDDIPGVTSPMIYIGMLFSWFAWHVEDHELHSLNFLHMGSPKTWYAIPGDYAFTFEEVIRSKAYGGGIDRLAALTLLGEKTTLLSPETVVASGIPCCRLVQNPGEFVVTFPRAYHIGFSHGFNCGEAANFGTPRWLSIAKEAAVRRAAMNFLPMLSHQHLLYLLTMSFIPRMPRYLLPGVRSSRLRDRQKEERERLVKKEFVEDILKENKLLTSLLQKRSSYRAVLWDLESLPPTLLRVSDLSNIAVNNIVIASVENIHIENENNLDNFRQMSQDTETLLHMENDDMASDFHVDSGTLPCVACGVLGFPFMSIIQPSVKALMGNIPAKNPSVAQDIWIQKLRDGMVDDCFSDGQSGGEKCSKNRICSDHPNIASSEAQLVSAEDGPVEASTDASKVNVDNGWNMSDGFLRPRIFCLEHACKIEELLDSKGGAEVLIICNSDFQKIKVQAAAIAEQIGSTFKYNEVQLDQASRDDLNLINLAIDNEQEVSAEDWTTKLNVNLRQSFKFRNKLSPNKTHHALALDALFPDATTASRQVIFQWQVRKSRSNRKLNRSSSREPSKTTSGDKDLALKAKFSEAETPRKEVTLIQYTRRCSKLKAQDSVTNLGKDRNENGSLALGNLSTTEKSDIQPEKQIVVENSILPHVAVEVFANAAVVETAEVQTDNQTSMEMEGEFEEPEDNCGAENSTGLVTCASQSVESSESEKDDGSDEETSEKNETSDLESENDSGEECSRESNEYVMEEGSELAKSGGSCADETVTDLNVQDQITHKSDENNPVSTSFTSKSRSKRRRELDLLIEEHSNVDGFIRSPCEGLRPRGQKDLHRSPTLDTMKTIPEKPAKKARASNPKTPKKDEKQKTPGAHRCDQDGCKLSFRTKTELSLHRKNKCPYEGCGKKFSSHRYAVLHFRVHQDDRPLKCSWKGCKMTFKWAWARTEHLRVHTGERPYKCRVEGCERTFRFVSDFSRHRRKTGHYVNVKA